MKKKASQILKKLTDPLAVAPWMLEADTDDCVRDGFSPRGTDFRDFCLVWRNGECHFFYIDARLDQHSRTWGQAVQFGHAVTRDLAHWRVLDPALFVDPGHWDGRAIWAPNVIELNGTYYMFYTGLNSMLSQSIGVATSDDLIHWERYHGNPVLSPGCFDWCHWSRETLANCRDPHVYQRRNEFFLFYTALCKTGEVCIAAARSANLFDWSDCGPVIRFLPDRRSSPLALESSCVHKVGRRCLLCYSHNDAIFINLSNSHLSFDPENSTPVLKGYLGLEKVAELGRDGRTWLVAFFNRVTRGSPSRLFFGALDLRAVKPKIKLISCRREMAEVLSAARPHV